MAKTGVDDYLAAGGTIAELKLMARPYSPADFAEVRLSRDEKLRAGIGDLRRKCRAMPTRKGPDCTDRSTAREIVRVAERHGKPVEDGIMVRVSVRTLALAVRISTRSQSKSLERLQGSGFLRRVDEPDKPKEQAAAYVLLTPWGGGSAESKHKGKKGEAEAGQRQTPQSFSPHSKSTYDRGVYLARAPSDRVPELRWSKLILYWATVKGRRKVVDWQYVARVGKKRGAILEYLLDRGGACEVPELLARFATPRTRPRDFRARMLDPLQADGMLAVDSSAVALTDEWRERLEAVRAQTEELEDNDRQSERYAEGRRKFRRRDEHPADKQPSPLRGKEEVARIVEERRKEERRRWVEEQREKVGTTAATFLADELEEISGVRYKDVRTRWASRGGSVEDLRRAVLYGPWRFKREEDGDLYIYHEDAEDRPGGPNARIWRERQGSLEAERERKLPPKVDGIIPHGPLCDCEWCSDPPEPKYAVVSRGMP